MADQKSKNIRTATALFICVLTASTSWAFDPCTTVNNETPEMGNLRSQRVTEQDKYLYFDVNGKRTKNSVGWCFAYSAADLVSHRLKKKISAADISINYDIAADETLKGGFNQTLGAAEGGHSQVAIQITNNVAGGFCPEERIKSDTFGNLAENDSIFQSFRLTSDVHKSRFEDSCSSATTVASNMLPDMSVQQIAEITSKYAGSQRTKWAELTKVACVGHRIALPEGVRVRSLASSQVSRSGVVAQIDRQLTNGSIGIIEYDYGRLPMKNFFYNLVPKNLRIAAYHASTVVGRKFSPETGQCMYKIRNTWGSKCYDLTDSPASGCEDGYLWISRDNLIEAAHGAVWLE